MPEVLEETDQQRRLRVTRPDTATLDKNNGLVRLPACVSHDLLWHNLNVEAPSTDLVAFHTAPPVVANIRERVPASVGKSFRGPEAAFCI